MAAALGIGLFIGLAAFPTCSVIIAGIGVALSAMGLLVLADAARTGVQVLTDTTAP
jgi:hypothetical protein